jgi:glycosyltransferase involved in cell wall biosynthesis
MRIVHVVARLNVGGAALSILELAAGQRARGHDVLVVAGRVPPNEESLEYMASDLDVPYLNMPELGRELDPRADTAAIRRLRRLLREQRTDVLHTHTAKAGAVGRTAARLAGRSRPSAVVHTYHGHVLSGYFDTRRERVFRSIERGLAHWTDTLIAVTPEVRDELAAFGLPARKLVVVRYGFDLDARVAAAPDARRRRREEAGIPQDAFVIGWAGRLTAIKLPLDLVRVAAAVDGAQLVLLGDGEERSAVTALAATLGIADRVHLLGFRRDVGAWYAAFDTFLLTSANEGSPVVAIEALAAGVPVVATRAGGTAAVVDDGETGLLAATGDVDTLSTHVRRLRDDDALRAKLGATGAARMRERFSTKRMVDDVERVYRGIIDA